MPCQYQVALPRSLLDFFGSHILWLLDKHSEHKSKKLKPEYFLTQSDWVSILVFKLLHPGGCVALTNADHHSGAWEVEGNRERLLHSLNEAAAPEAMTLPVAEPQTQALLLSQNKNPTCKQQEKTSQEWQNKQMEPHRGCPHTHACTQQREKHTRWTSVSTKTRQACNRNQTNSNDFPALLPYKGKGTPSRKVQLMTAVVFAPPGPQIPLGVRLAECGLLLGSHFHSGVFVCWRVCLVRSAPSSLA